MNLNQIICFQPGPKQRWLIVFVAWTVALLIGVVHELTGPQIELHSFYLAPILVVTWFVGVRWGTATALLSIANWMAVDFGLGLDWSSDRVVLLNEVIRFSVYMLLVVVAWQWRRALDREANLARHDTLTQLPNRRAFFELAKIELERARRYGHTLTAIMLDLDNFKAVNDQMGHQRGDELLRTISNILREVSRSSDVAGRLGGDEFAIVLPETDATAAMAFSEKLRREVLAAMQRENLPVTISLGVATFHTMPQHVDQLLKRADDLMYAVKVSGKNQIKHALID
jgi:diguanylate cyclase (GGDEF)-like protein